jgi:hypothetical protein
MILYEVFEIFHYPHPSGHTMAMESTQPLTEMSARDFFGGEGGRCVGLKTLPPLCADCPEILVVSTFWSPRGLSRPVLG